ncbi:MAG: hypothetical protein E6K77_05340 [Candidatus Eisenbacteria bacterium]|uniref:Uncharacterized protein n=1 Tax=Eiseniibacteriota bacterium TaxID=2212470 RepID=A0A538TIC6_UNCEI|nr:MAG: hypothetical protein E6K77_05340 [Candidatus Eisenbacteria bacterium]
MKRWTMSGFARRSAPRLWTMSRNGRELKSWGVRTARWSSRLTRADAVSAAEDALAISWRRRAACPF